MDKIVSYKNFSYCISIDLLSFLYYQVRTKYLLVEAYKMDNHENQYKHQTSKDSKQQGQEDDCGEDDPYGDTPVYGEDASQDSQHGQSEDIRTNETMAPHTSQFENRQDDRSNLHKVIKKEVKAVDDLICLGQQWAMIYYYLCGWNRKLVEQYVDVDNTYKKMLHYQPGNLKFANQGQLQCIICSGEANDILRNLCGHSCCADCWKNQIEYRMKDFQDPFPPCIYQNCCIRVSHLLSQQICKRDPAFQSLYQKTLCRSYAQLNRTVKVCWGTNCTNCFFIKNPFQVTQCQQCKNFICLFCGFEHHAPAECHDISTWRQQCKNFICLFCGFEQHAPAECHDIPTWRQQCKNFNCLFCGFEHHAQNEYNDIPTWRRVAQFSTSFVDEFNYRICPACKEAVERRSGCNSIVCRCKNQFCYICGQNWVPNHQAHGSCHRQRQARELDVQRRKKRQNQKEFCTNMLETQNQQNRLQSIIKRVDGLDINYLKNQLVKKCQIFDIDLSFITHYLKILRLGLMYQKFGYISTFLNPKILIKTTINKIKPCCQEIDDFFFEFIPNLLNMVQKPNFDSNNKGKWEISYEALQKDSRQVFMLQKKKIADFVSLVQKHIELQKHN